MTCPDIEFKKVSFVLDMMDVATNRAKVGTFKEFDNVKFAIQIANDKRPMPLKDKIIKLYAELPDGTPMYQEKGITILDPINGIIDIIPKSLALSQIGTIKCEVEVFNCDGSVLTSGGFDFLVIDKANNLDTDEEVGEAIDFLKEIFEFSEKIVPAEEARVQAELTRNNSELERLAGEDLRRENEADRIERFNIMEDKVNTVISNAEIDSIISNALS